MSRTPLGCTNINFGALLVGNGTAWFDTLAVELDGTPYVNDALFDFDFESPSPKGFFTGGCGYSVQLDSTVTHTGNQGLRMQYVGGCLGVTADTVAQCRAIVTDAKFLRSSPLGSLLVMPRRLG
jgi:hypothetical protein